MRNIILYTALSLDSYIAQPDGDIDWLESAEKIPG
jgi:dihydrofolate reductase